MKGTYILCAAAVFALSAPAQEAGQKTFTSAADASNALVHSVQTNNEQALEAVLGKGVISADKEAARLERHQFAEKYDQMHRLIQEPNGAMVLYVGAENWPFPVPLVSNNGKWFFDSEAGKEEIQYRKVGEDEITAMEICERFEAAKKQRVRKVSTDGDPLTQTAETLAAGSPASEETYSGYVFRVVGNGGNVVLVAYPEEYRISGVTTFILTNDGKVYQKDLGNGTEQAAAQLKALPASGWQAVH
ncbi:MAG TPA: DUF2950 family protein [Bryobacteraceae bacterium]|jgi:hypothetical protein